MENKTKSNEEIRNEKRLEEESITRMGGWWAEADFGD